MTFDPLMLHALEQSLRKSTAAPITASIWVTWEEHPKHGGRLMVDAMHGRKFRVTFGSKFVHRLDSVDHAREVFRRFVAEVERLLRRYFHVNPPPLPAS